MVQKRCRSMYDLCFDKGYTAPVLSACASQLLDLILEQMKVSDPTESTIEVERTYIMIQRCHKHLSCIGSLWGHFHFISVIHISHVFKLMWMWLSALGQNCRITWWSDHPFSYGINQCVEGRGRPFFDEVQCCRRLGGDEGGVVLFNRHLNACCICYDDQRAPCYQLSAEMFWFR